MREEQPIARRCASSPPHVWSSARQSTRPLREASLSHLPRNVSSGSLHELGRSRNACSAALLLVLLVMSLGCTVFLFRSHGTRLLEQYAELSRRGLRPALSRKPLRLCFVLDESTSEHSVAITLAQLLRALTRRKAEVIVLELPIATSARRANGAHWAREQDHHCRERRRLLSAISGVLRQDLPATRHKYDASVVPETSLRVHQFLSDRQPRFDTVVFHSNIAVAYYSLLARGQAIAHVGTRISLLLGPPVPWPRRQRGRESVSLSELEEGYMVRSALRLADAMFAPQGVIQLLRGDGRVLPVHSKTWRMENSSARSGEISGAAVAALARSPHHSSDDGLQGQGDGEESYGELAKSTRRGGAWRGTQTRATEEDEPCPTKTRPHGGCSGVHPVISWLTTSRSSGESARGRGPEARLMSVPSNASSVRPDNLQGVHQSALPLVSVCVVHHERGAFLLQALHSIRAQTLRPSQLETVLVDDGSVSAASLRILDSVATWPEFSSGQWLLLRQPSRFLGAARNAAAARARGQFLYFLDDDNYLKRHALATLLGAARASNAHVLTSLNEKWPYSLQPPESDDTSERWLPLGAAAAVGLFKNCYGDANALIRRDVFKALGGFTEDRGVGHEDWELWARAVLRGFNLQVVPEALYWYRLAGGGMLSESIGSSQSAQALRYANNARNLRPYLERLSGWPEAQDVVRLAQGMFLVDRETSKGGK